VLEDTADERYDSVADAIGTRRGILMVTYYPNTVLLVTLLLPQGRDAGR